MGVLAGKLGLAKSVPFASDQGMAGPDLRQKILEAVVSLEVTKGHLKWKISDVARMSKSSRPSVYYHFGATKKEILQTCIDWIATDYYGLNADRADTLIDGRLLASLLKTRTMFLANPALAVVYQKWRTQADSPMAKQLIAIEKRYQKKISQAFPHLDATRVLALHAIFHGLITAPFVTDAAITVGLQACRVLISGDRS